MMEEDVAQVAKIPGSSAASNRVSTTDEIESLFTSLDELTPLLAR